MAGRCTQTLNRNFEAACIELLITAKSLIFRGFCRDLVRLDSYGFICLADSADYEANGPGHVLCAKHTCSEGVRYPIRVQEEDQNPMRLTGRAPAA